MRVTLIAVAAGWALSALAGASPSVLGVWHGNIRYDLTKLPPSLPAYKREYLASEAKRRLNDKLTLTLTKDHKFTLLVEVPKTTPPAIVGKWVQDGSTIQIQVVKEGKPSAAQDFIVSKDGKTITFQQPASPASYHFWR
jgi:hypothetical protein